MVSAKKVVCLNLLVLLLAGRVFCLEMTVQASGPAFFPIGETSSGLYSSVNWGGFADVDVDFFHLLSAGLEGGYLLAPHRSTTTSSSFITFGLNASAHFFPISRLKLEVGGTGGIYQCYSQNKDPKGNLTVDSYGNFWFRAYASAGFRFSPYITLAATGGYILFNYPQEPIYTGISAGLSFQFAIDTQVSVGNIAVSLDQPEPVFPLFYSIYKQASIGTLTVVNNETAEIRDVSVSFRAGKYTSSLMLCGSVPSIQKHASSRVQLYADFSDVIQNFTENGKMPGELVITYELLGAARNISKTIVVPVYNRNTVRWTDNSVIASYISPKAPEVLDYSKYIVGIAREKLRTGLNRNMQFAMYLYEGLKVGGITYSNDASTPYVSFHKNADSLDYIQYPFQTLAYHSGDYDDLGILYAAALESVGVRAAIIPLDNDFVVAFSLGITAADAESLFASMDNILSIQDEIWIPVSMATFREGFVNSWYTAMNELNAAFESGANPDFVVLGEAWKTYPPASITGSEASFQKPLEESVAKAVDTDLLRYISAEFGPKIRAVQDQIKQKGGSQQLYNQLGLLYVRAGMYDEAKSVYKKSAELKSVTAMVNLGNIALLEKDFTTADEWFKKALLIQPDSKAALNGLNRVETELSE
jgi:tetratricopeptide (TPR) repeat protein